MPTRYSPKEAPRDQSVTSTAGIYANPSDAPKPYDLITLVESAYRNYTSYPISVVQGLTFNQFELLKEEHYYLSSKFLQGDTDSNGNKKYFHNIILPRVQHVTKNIDIDTKDIMVTADNPDGWWFSFLLRNEIQKWMRDEGMAELLNDLCEHLPKFGKVIWKKYYDEDAESGEPKLCIKEVDLRDVIFDPSGKSIKDGLFLERAVLYPWQIMNKVKAGHWNEQAAKAAIRSAIDKADKFMKEGGPESTAETEYSITDTASYVDVYEGYGYIPVVSFKMYEAEMKGEVFEPDPNSDEDIEYVYVKMVVSGLESGSTQVLYLNEVDPEEDFPYVDFNLPFKIPGRCLPLSYTEMLSGLQIRVNELVGRFFQGLRFGSLFLYQTKGKTDYANLLSDALEGDIIEAKHEILPIQTEMRAFNQYQTELQICEAQADRICNSVEVVTGESMPTNTPFRLGAQLGVAAGKVFERIREDIGITLTEVFSEWVIPEILDTLSAEHVIEVMGSVEEMKAFDEKYRKFLLADSVKKYVLSNGYLPTESELRTVETTLAEQIKNESRKVKIEKKYFTKDTLKNLRIFVDVTDERKNFQAEKETMTNLLQLAAANPMILQDETTKLLVGKLLEASNFSPLQLAAFTSKPSQPQVGGPMSPAQQAFAQNPGDAMPGNQETKAAQMQSA